MKYAVVQTGGKQYKVSEGSPLEVDRLTAEPGSNFTFEHVLLVADEGKVQLGTPYVDGVAVTAKVIEHTKGEKIRVSKFKAKARYRRVTGHRQALTKLEVAIIAAGKIPAASKAKEEKAARPIQDKKEKA